MKTYEEVISSQARFIMSKQIRSDPPAPMNGAIRRSNTLVVPGFSNLAAIALALSGEPGSLRSVAEYVTWYLNGIMWPDASQTYGTMSDYEYKERDSTWQWVRLGTYAAADSYAATFVSLLRTYVQAGGNTQVLLGFGHRIESVAQVMVGLMQDDHLTLSVPNGQFKLLMNNCQVYRGLTDAAWLFEHVFHDAAKAQHFQDRAQANRQGILDELVNGKEFFVSKSGNGRAAVNWEKWYADTVSQLYPLVYGAIDADDQMARHAYERMRSYHPNWNCFDDHDPPDPSGFPWAFVAHAAALLGELGDLARFKEAAERKYIDKPESSRWPPAEAGWLMRACRHARTAAGWWASRFEPRRAH